MHTAQRPENHSDAPKGPSSGGPSAPSVRDDRSITARAVKPGFDDVCDPLWFRADRFRTHFYNAYTLLLADESVFVELVRTFAPQVEDATLRKQLRGFIAQETAHGVQHARAHSIFDRFGLRYRGWLKALRYVNYSLLTGIMGKRLTLAVTAGLENFNAMLGEVALRDPDYFRDVDGEMAELLRWHFAEEIEHRAVLHDVTRELGIGTRVRITTGIAAYVIYVLNLGLTTGWFAAQDGSLTRLSTYRSALRFLFTDERFIQYILTYLRDYLRRDFHPLDRQNDELANRVFDRA